ncbi:hypothetical protein Glove_441g93 [Diversispora epigaea]|uniref:Attractin/MKLN-like beta-propeller domain-containing protein n=1 Tax=Diversispora epigaea TaxID=1348612 RepID=A0A397GR01_9GLOM|nr:hypothetical protein Glove_441g93 [Diversispora epigaea]
MYLPFKLFKIIFCTLLLIISILCYDPTERKYHSGVVIDDRLLIFGGDTNITELTFELFYLDLSKSFDNNNLTWVLIPEGSLPVYTYDSAAVLSSDNYNYTIYLIGGFMRNKNTFDYDYSNLVYAYNYPASTWSTQPGGDSVPPRQNMKGVIDNSGIIYIFGGFNATNVEESEYIGTDYNDMNILNTAKMTWSTLDISANLPNKCAGYTANILPSGIIVYTGGLEQVSDNANLTLVNMNEIKLFDTNEYEWSYINATGDEIDPRWYFSSVLTPDGNIIIFGGCTRNFTIVNPKLATLNTSKDPFEWFWFIPNSSKANTPPSIYGHTANLYYDYMMIITFGYNIDNQTYNSQVYLYDIKNNTWVTIFISIANNTIPFVQVSTYPTPTPSFSIPTSTFPIIIVMIIVIIGFIAISIVIFISCRNKERNSSS